MGSRASIIWHSAPMSLSCFSKEVAREILDPTLKNVVDGSKPLHDIVVPDNGAVGYFV